ncbi:hypothetical protein [Massilia sp. METH4]|uniref:hypothetical protein n=1 Tax=Massilia sp. METH4 TaxID=3123041 RepID=UPI0030CCBDF7
MPGSKKAINSAGSGLLVCLSLPASNNAAGYEALNWIEVGEITGIAGDIGRVYDEIEVKNLRQRLKEKRKGAYTEGAPSITTNYAPGDDGQIAMETALMQDGNVSFCIELSDGTSKYAQGIVLSSPFSIGDVGSLVSGTYNIAFNTNIVTVLPA